MKKYLITGFIILLPVLFTIILFGFVINLFTDPFMNLFLNLLSKLESVLPFLKNSFFVHLIAKILIIILLCIFILILGFITRWFLFNYFLKLTNKIFSKIPFIKTIYFSLKEIVSAFGKNERKAFKKTVMIKFPCDSSYFIGFESGETPKEIQEKIKEKLIPVILPTAPHPISGFFVFVPEEEIHSIKMTNQDTVKFILSCGVITPGEQIKDEPK